MVEVCGSSGGSQFSKFTQSSVRPAFGRRFTSMLWLGFIKIDKIMMKLTYFFGPLFWSSCGIGRGTASIALWVGQYYTGYFKRDSSQDTPCKRLLSWKVSCKESPLARSLLRGVFCKESPPLARSLSQGVSREEFLARSLARSLIKDLVWRN